MKLDLDFSVVSRFFTGIVNDLRKNRLWPVAVLLLAGLVAVPLLLSNSPSPAPKAQASLPAAPPPAPAALPALNVQSTPAHSRITGSARNPFGSSTASSSTTTTAASGSAAGSAVVSTATATSNGLAGLSGGSSGAAASSGGSSAPSSVVSSAPSTGSTPSGPLSITPNAHPTPARHGLTSTESYDVSLAVTANQGGVNTIDPLERLSVIPNPQQPQLVELGVLQGGNRVLFAVQPGTVLSGPGTCIPGPIDCEIVSLRQNQTESIAARGATGPGSAVLFAVTGISATDHGTVAAANRARRMASAAGRALLIKSTSQTLSMFHYDPSLGSIVDLRNLTAVGGN